MLPFYLDFQQMREGGTCDTQLSTHAKGVCSKFLHYSRAVLSQGEVSAQHPSAFTSELGKRVPSPGPSPSAECPIAVC